MTKTMTELVELRDALEHLDETVGSLVHGSVRAQSQGTDRKLADYLGLDWQALLEADWHAAEHEQHRRRFVQRVNECAGEVA